MNYMRYHRDVLMLEEQSSGFCAKAGAVRGHLKIETGSNKGALRCQVQNLRYYPRGEYVYKLIFFGKKNERTIHAVIGTLMINKNGSGETYFRFHPRDVDGKGNEYADFSTVIIAAVSSYDEKEPLHPILKGETGNAPAPSLHREESAVRAANTDEDRGKNDKDESPEMTEIKTEEKERENSELNMGKIYREIEAATAKDNERLEESKNDRNNRSNTINIDKIEYKRKEEEAKEAQKEEKNEETVEKEAVPQNYNRFYNDYLLQACGHMCRVAEFYEDVMPFSEDVTGAKWKKIKNVGSLPIVSPGAQYFSTQYRHYLFGAKGNPQGFAENYFIAVPGRFTEVERPDGGKSGFTYWQPMYGAAREKNAYGYWIVEINAKTGDIVEVKKQKR
ncbi:hypothetical protein [Sinanaerobacter sp. ZZT-01]|uniref:DUF7922 domain-containing protein n=1 Tax=Sinanaerobacter sp. ZZT-01 TaxID=3111540 RepID=UPI002D7814E7|nr:hypothetical protein [Sinanaerobacter sp. ZZT-01]WRR94630.1 hypothetical protein U5921_05825 [Sinanaerobacter sp. ZZT-01]